MAYMNQERKAVLAAAVKRVIPAGWKYTLSVRNHSTIVMTVSQAPVDVCGIFDAMHDASHARGVYQFERTETSDHVNVNEYHSVRNLTDFGCGEFARQLQDVIDALNVGNHDRSDIQSDYFDVGWYVDIRFGAWNKPFRNTGAAFDAAAPVQAAAAPVAAPAPVVAPAPVAVAVAVPAASNVVDFAAFRAARLARSA